MELVKNFFSNSDDSDNKTALDTIEKLTERLNTSVRLEDRRDAMRAIKALSKDYRLEVGTNTIFVCSSILKNDSDDTELVSYAVETLYNMMCDSLNEEINSKRLVHIQPDLGGLFTEMFVKDFQNIENIINLIDSYELHLKRSVIRLTTLMLTNRPKDLQKYILACPNAIPRILDVLNDPREVIRNEGILTLIHLTQNNIHIQNIVAYDNTFGIILDIIVKEESINGDLIVEDCLKLLKSLLLRNSSNQILFKEGGYIRRINEFFNFTTSSLNGWTSQKIVNYSGMLKVIRSLVCPSNKFNTRQTCQKEMQTCGLLEKICSLIFTNGVPNEVLTEAIYTSGEMVRGHSQNQQYLASFSAPSNPPQPAVTVLLMTMFGEAQPFSLRLAVFYCFQCLLYNNMEGQKQIISILHPNPNASPIELKPGLLLFTGLFSNDPASTWFAAMSLAHAINENTSLKENLLNVQLASSPESQSVSLLNQCFNLLGQKGMKIQARVGLLQFLCIWLCRCSVAVIKFIKPNSTETNKDGFNMNLSLLISEAASDDADQFEGTVRGLVALLIGICICYLPNDDNGSRRNNLLGVVDKRVGLDVILERIHQLARSEPFITAMRAPQPTESNPQELLFDYQFTSLFRTMEYEVSMILNDKNSSLNFQDNKIELTDGLNFPNDQSPTKNLEASEIEKLKSNLNDALLMMNNLDVKCKAYKSRLRKLNQDVSDDSDAEESDLRGNSNITNKHDSIPQVSVDQSINVSNIQTFSHVSAQQDAPIQTMQNDISNQPYAQNYSNQMQNIQSYNHLNQELQHQPLTHIQHQVPQDQQFTLMHQTPQSVNYLNGAQSHFYPNSPQTSGNFHNYNYPNTNNSLS